MKHAIKIFSVLAVCLCLSACGSSGGIAKEEYDKVIAERDEYKDKYEELLQSSKNREPENIDSDSPAEDPAMPDPSSNQDAEATSGENDVEILAEYILPDRFRYHTYHLLVVKNNSDHTVEINTSSIAYDENGTILGATNSDIEALGSGSVSLIDEIFEVEGTIDYVETEMDISVPKRYNSVIENLSYTQSDIANGAVFQVTNHGEAAERVAGYCLFFKDGEMVDFDVEYFNDQNDYLETGATETRQMDTSKEFDTIEFYLDGRNKITESGTSDFSSGTSGSFSEGYSSSGGHSSSSGGHSSGGSSHSSSK